MTLNDDEKKWLIMKYSSSLWSSMNLGRCIEIFFFVPWSYYPTIDRHFFFRFHFSMNWKKTSLKIETNFFCHSKQKKITNFESFFTFHWDFLNFFFHLANRIRLNFKSVRHTHTHNCRRPNKTEIFRLIN